MNKSKFALLFGATFLTLHIFTPNVSAVTKTVEKKIPVQFLGINDLHGFIEGNSSKAENGKAIGGMASLAYNFQQEKSSFATKNKLKSTTSHTVLVQSGDIVGGSPAISGLLQDQPTMNIMNAIGFQVGTVGNHEFDEGISEFKRILNGNRPTYDTANYENVLYYNTTKSQTSIVISNVVDKKTGKLLSGFNPYTIKKVDGVKIGYIGVVTPNIKDIVMDEHMKNIKVIQPEVAVAKYTKKLRKKGVKAIVILAHSGAEMSSTAGKTIDTQKNSTVAGDVAKMLKGVNKIDPNNSIDIVFSGHSHTFVNGTYKKTLVVQALNYGNAYSKVTGVLSSKTKDFLATPQAEIKYNYTKSHTTLTKNTIAKKVTTILNDANKRVDPIINSKIATMKVSRINSVPEKNGFGAAIGNIIADAQLNMAIDKQYPTDFAFTNTGGVRTDLIGKKVGSNYVVTWGAAQAVQPFKNFLQHVTMTGSQIHSVLAAQFNNGDRKLEVAGLHYTYNNKGIVDIFVDGSNSPLELGKTYNVVINDYLSGGKDNYDAFKKAKNVKTIAIDTDIFIEYLIKLKTIDSTYSSRAIRVN